MKKYLLSMMTIMMMALVSVSFVACGDDDEKDNNGGGNSGGGGSNDPSGVVTNKDVLGTWYLIEEEGSQKICVVGMEFRENGVGSFAEFKAKAKNNWEPETNIYTISWSLDGQVLTMKGNDKVMKGIILSKTDSTFLVRRDLESSTDEVVIRRAKNIQEVTNIFLNLKNGQGTGGGGDQPSGNSKIDANGFIFDYSSTNGYWLGEENAFYVQMFNCELYKAIGDQDAQAIINMPENLQMITIGFPTEGTLKRMTTGRFAPFYVIISSIPKQQFLEGDGDPSAEYEAEGYEGEVTITQNGNLYTVSFGSVEFVDATDKGNPSFTINGFSWTGTMTEVPEFMREKNKARFGRLF